MARKTYKFELNSQKSIYYEQKFNACGNDSHNIFKLVNSILGTNTKSKYAVLLDSILCSSFVNCLSINISQVSDSISSKLAQSLMTFNSHVTYNPISCTFSSVLPISITEIRNLILSVNSTSPIDYLKPILEKKVT